MRLARIMILKLPSNTRVDLKPLAEEVSDSLYLLMRVYFEASYYRWLEKVINHLHMDGLFDVEGGLKIARNLLVELVSMGLPLATEALDPNSPHTWADPFSRLAIRCAYYRIQTHCEMASGLSMPVGFQDGSHRFMATAINAMRAAAMPHRFVGISTWPVRGLPAAHRGAPDGHVIPARR
ncbi:hypothetical protein ACNKHQ_15305 [Shigella flexneri]